MECNEMKSYEMLCPSLAKQITGTKSLLPWYMYWGESVDLCQLQYNLNVCVYICSLLYIKKSAFVLFLGNRPSGGSVLYYADLGRKSNF